MNLSFTLDEKIFTDIQPEKLIQKSVTHGISSLEISPDTDVLSLDEYKNIINIISSHNLDANYHIPYFANNIYDIKHFSLYQDKLKEKYISFLNLLENFQQKLDNNPVIVIHGCDYSEIDRSESIDNTLKFLDWILNIVSKRKLPFTIALETLRKKSLRNTFDNREDIFFFLNTFKCDNLKVCLDMCHDKLNYYPDKPSMDRSFLKEVIYSHIHGHDLSTDTSHIALSDSDLNYDLELENLLEIDFKGSINIELLSNFSKSTYIDDLFNDIDYMNRYI